MKEFVNWLDVESYINDVCEKYKNNKLSGVYGLPRGGLVFAVIISHRLNIPMLMSPCENCLIVDDISDTGKTLIHYRDLGYLITTMFYNKNSLVKPDFYKFEKKDDWVVYPWENRND